jgi:hypothetical protein
MIYDIILVTSYVTTHPPSCAYEIITERNPRLRIIGTSGYLVCVLWFSHIGYSPIAAFCLATLFIEVFVRFLLIVSIIYMSHPSLSH